MIDFFGKYKQYLKNPISKETINDIHYYLENGWYLQLLKEFGIVIVLILMKYFESKEDYKKCEKLKNTILNSNKYFGTDNPLNIEEYARMS